MPSLRSKILDVYLRYAMKSRPLHLLPPQVLRAGADRVGYLTVRNPKHIAAVNEAGFKGEWHKPETHCEERAAILYFHGGGYYFGSPTSTRGLTFGLAKHSGAPVFSVDYRMAPEAPYPAALDDAVAAYNYLLGAGYRASKIIVGGDSAGGGLALAMMIALQRAGLPLPAGATLYSPWTDLAATGATLDFNEKSDVMFKKEYLVEGAKKYYCENDPKDPLISPLYADLLGLPPLLVFVSDDEVLLDDSLRLVEKARAAGVETKLIREPGLAHVWPMFHPLTPESIRAVKQSAAFIKSRLQ